MIKKTFIICFLIILKKAESQNWDSLPGGSRASIEAVIYDSLHNELIVSSKVMSQIGNNLPVNNVARWNGIKWDSLVGGIKNFGGEVLCGIPFNGKLLVGGLFNKIGGVNGTTSLALWDGNKWDSLPKRAFAYSTTPPQVWGFFKKNNLIYIYGNFRTIDGQPATGLATWDGTNFTPIVLPIASSFVRISGVLEYQNEIYVCGGFFNGTSGTAYDILKFNGISWVSTTGGGLKGGFSNVITITVYNNELYAGGHFWMSDGNFGNNIMKWDGIQWHDVGFGGDPNIGAVVIKFLIHHNKLWAIGNYAVASNMPARSIAVYDGIKWCTLKDTLDNGLQSAAIYKDTIYVGGAFSSVNGDSSYKFLLKLKDPNQYRNCNMAGINETSPSQNEIAFYPNPITNTLHIANEQFSNGGSKIEIINALGQVVLTLPFANEIDVSELPQGFYGIKIITASKIEINSKFIKN